MKLHQHHSQKNRGGVLQYSILSGTAVKVAAWHLQHNKVLRSKTREHLIIAVFL